tara:strand:- start:133 stop:516 length:384 start_codon:yes stop_codon:yes gene_type:complete
MNLDLAIRNTLKMGAMENAMNSVVSTYGQSYELHAIPYDVKRAEQIMGSKVGMAQSNPLARANSTSQPIPWIDGVHHADTTVPSPITMASNDVMRNSPKTLIGTPLGNQPVPQVITKGVNLAQRRKF